MDVLYDTAKNANLWLGVQPNCSDANGKHLCINVASDIRLQIRLLDLELDTPRSNADR